ncbi:MAG: DUF4132 domain-containing protein, partial [Myxococcales bacterium]|nr:DUF4132 domain-containing protein [Myxococcales bacterium]
FYLAPRTWKFAAWKERYLDHPLVGRLAEALIWRFRVGKNVSKGLWDGRQFVDAKGKPLRPAAGAEVELWHPLGEKQPEVATWRRLLLERELTQPFKQAHREVYVLTEAERRTGTYSNRFAAHILRQHQLNALATSRGWKAPLRLMVDDAYPPVHRELPAANLRAEYWVDGSGEGDGELASSGAFLRVATDQVRFYRLAAAENEAHAYHAGYRSTGRNTPANRPVRLDRVPPLVLSEILRDVDLFVGVASVGNDPTWFDGGPDGRFIEYWQRYSFGELTATAQTRKALLEVLVPKLKIASVCSFLDRFLVVKGQLRTYKIHLGSGNILMEPNEQYLCIVPQQTAKAP